MTRLLVSVRSAVEAAAALAGGADVIDIKEPRRGALGPADPHVWQDVRRVVGQQVEISVALGELLFDPVEELAPHARGLAFAKIGLAGCHTQPGWLARWRSALRALPPGVAPVPVAYADWPHAAAPSPSVAISLAAFTPERLLLIDTHNKSAGALLDCLSLEFLEELMAYAAQHEVRLALAGSLTAQAIQRLLALAPAYIGVRGAACSGGREGTIDAARVKPLADIVQALAQKASC